MIHPLTMAFSSLRSIDDDDDYNKDNGMGMMIMKRQVVSITDQDLSCERMVGLR